MSDPINDGGAAFPVTLNQWGGVGGYGMSMRDWFAGMALQGALACPDSPEGITQEQMRDNLAQICWDYADAMLAARTKGGEQ